MTFPLPNDPSFPVDGRFPPPLNPIVPPLSQQVGQTPNLGSLNFPPNGIQSQPTPAMLPQGVAPPNPAHQMILTPDQFENLKRSMQLLRISQLRYIVQKYSLPANGNKTRLLRTVLQLIDAMRNAPLLCQINADVSNLIAFQHEPFSNPLAIMHRIFPAKPESMKDLVFNPPNNPFVHYLAGQPICGPLYAQSGSSTGNFQFNSNNLTHRVIMDFAWQTENPAPFEMTAEINGFPINVFIEDPNPQPIDITEYVHGRDVSVVDIKCVKTQSNLCITIRLYEYLTITQLASQIVHSELTPSSIVFVKGPQCEHKEGFELFPFLIKSLITKQFLFNSCPICSKKFSLSNLQVASQPPANQEQQFPIQQNLPANH